MKKQPFILMFMYLIVGGMTSHVSANQVITTYLQVPSEKIRSDVNHTEKITAAGTAFGYAGFLDYADSVGNGEAQITVPKKHDPTQIRVVITKNPQAIIPQGTTISHYALAPDVPATMFLFSQKEETLTLSANGQSTEKKVWYWEVTEEEIPADRKLRAVTIIIFADPADIHVNTAEKHLILERGPNTVLPPVFTVLSTQQSLDHFAHQNNFELMNVATQEVTQNGSTVQTQMITNV